MENKYKIGDQVSAKIDILDDSDENEGYEYAAAGDLLTILGEEDSCGNILVELEDKSAFKFSVNIDEIELTATPLLKTKSRLSNS